MRGSGAAPLIRFGTEAERALWAKKRGGASGNGKERLRDYSVSRVGSPKLPKKRSLRAGCIAAYD